MRLIKILIPVIIAIIATAIFYHNVSGVGIPFTHDGPMHLVRMVNYYLAIQQGQIPPRIGPNLANGFGYPVFNYNYPLANILAIPFFKLHLPYEKVFQFLTLSMIWIGCIGWWQWLSQYFSKWYIRLIGVCLYAANPYTLQLVFVRGGIGEIAATALIPWVLYYVNRTAQDKSTHSVVALGIVGGLFLLSHNVMVLLSIIPLVAFTLYTFAKASAYITKIILSLAIALGIAAFFWLPALGEKNMTILDTSPLSHDYEQHFVYPIQILSSAWGYGFSHAGPVDGLSFALSTIEIIGLLGSLIWYFHNYRNSPQFILLWVSLLIAIFFTLTLSQPLWHIIPLINFVQYPWRILLFVHLIAIIIILIWLNQITLNKSKRYQVLITLTIIISSVYSALLINKPVRRESRSLETWLRGGETTSTINENLPKNFSLDRAYQASDTIFHRNLIWTSVPGTNIRIDSWDGSKRTYTIIATEAATIVEHTAYFPGWEVKVDNQLVAVTNQDPWGIGLLSYEIDPGTHIISSAFTQHTFWRKIGNTISLITVLFLIGYELISVIHYPRKHL